MRMACFEQRRAILWTLFPCSPGICIRCGADVIFKPRGTELNRCGKQRRWRMKNIGGGSHSKSCPVKLIVGPRIRGQFYRESSRCCDALPWESCGCRNDSAGNAVDNVTRARSGNRMPVKAEPEP